MDSSALTEIATYHNDVVSSLKLYFSEASPTFVARFFDRRPDEIAAELADRVEETDRRSAFFVLATLERAFLADYESRCRGKMKDELSKAFRRIYKSKKTNVRLDEDIFEAWRRDRTLRQLIGELRGAFRFRHWMAHGRYAVRPTGKYDFGSIYLLAENVLNVFDFFEPE